MLSAISDFNQTDKGLLKNQRVKLDQPITATTLLMFLRHRSRP